MRAVVTAVAALGLTLFLFLPVPHKRLRGSPSLRILSRENTLLRRFQSPLDKAYSEWLPLREFPPSLIRSVITAEDSRFLQHCGVDILALHRALGQNLLHGRIVSGGSSITQQLARIAFRERMPRSGLLRKIVELFYAFRLEIQFSKDMILESYLNRVPLKFNQTGLVAAARSIFKRDIRFLTDEEQVALAVLIRQGYPERSQFRRRYLKLWERVYPNLKSDGKQPEKAVFIASPPALFNRESSTLHFESWIRQLAPDMEGDFQTALSENLNQRIGAILNSELKFLEKYGAENGAVVVMKNPCPENGGRLELAALVGSRNFHGDYDGQVNGCVIVRTAGSTLKPFLYSISMDQLGYQPNSILHDQDISLPSDEKETYRPRNNDLSYWGPLTLREALAASRNVPAIMMISRVGIPVFYRYLKENGFEHLKGEPELYGPGLALGSGGTTLLHLTRMYAGIAGGGIMHPLFIGTDDRGEDLYLGEKRHLMSERSAFQIIHILSDREIRRRAFGERNFLDFPFDVAAKTGTSKDFRDSWTIGFTRDYTVGVWIGNFSGKSMNGVSGGFGAARVFHQVIRLVTERQKPRFFYPENLQEITLCRKSGLRPAPGCPVYKELLEAGHHEIPLCGMNHGGMPVASENSEDIPRILSPVQGEVYILDPLAPSGDQSVPVRITTGKKSATGVKIPGTYFYSVNGGSRKAFRGDVDDILNLSRGEYTLHLYEGPTLLMTVSFRVQ